MNTQIKITIHCLIPILSGGLIYVLFRSQSLIMFSWINTIGFNELVNLLRAYTNANEVIMPDWFIYSFPDALWIYSFTSALIIVSGCKWSEYKVWLLLPIGLGFGIELLQYFNLFNGTFDTADLYSYILGTLLSICILNKNFKT